jgi:hypothetical protein
MFDFLRPLFSDSLPQQYRYADCFDRFEYLTALVSADLREKSATATKDEFIGPIGRFDWRNAGNKVLELMNAEITNFESNWSPLQHGLFDKSVERLKAVKAGYDDLLKRVRVTMF